MVAVALAASVTAATFVFTAWNTANGDWNVGGNWNTGNVPTAADQVSIGNAGTAQITTAGAAAASVEIHTDSHLTVSGSGTLASGGFTLALGGQLTVDGGASVTRTGTGTLRAGMVGQAFIQVEGAGSRIDWTGGSVVLGSENSSFLTLTDGGTFAAGTITTAANSTSAIRVGTGGLAGILSSDVEPDEGSTALYFNHSDDVTFARNVSGPVTLGKFGTGMLTLTNANTYRGPTIVSGGTLRAGVEYAVGTGDMRLTAPGRFDLNGFDQIIYDLEGDGTLALGSATLTAIVEDVSEFSGTITGSTLVKAGGAGLTLSGANTHTATIVRTGILFVNGNQPTSAVVLDDEDAEVGGTGRLGELTANEGQILPGVTTDALVDGILSSASASFGPAARLSIFVFGPAPGSEHSQLNVTGSVSLGDALLDIDSEAAVPVGTVLTIIDNDGPNPVAGTFAGLPEGASASADGQTFRISYAGGDGNDVTLTAAEPLAIDPPSLPDMTVGAPFSVTVTTSGGIAPYIYSVVSDELPVGLTLNAGTGEISGIPATAGPYEFSIRSEDALGGFETIEYEGEVLPAPVPSLPQIGLWALALAMAGVGYARLRASSSS
jgi:autotransporter-associated beta strand protein